MILIVETHVPVPLVDHKFHMGWHRIELGIGCDMPATDRLKAKHTTN
jgi:hypothetical protein